MRRRPHPSTCTVMVVKFSENCTDEEKREVCACLSQLFQLAKSLKLPTPNPKPPEAPGYPIPLVFTWLTKAVWPEHEDKSINKHSAKPVYREPRQKSHSFDKATADGVTKGQDGTTKILKRLSQPLILSPLSYECKRSPPVTPQSSRRASPLAPSPDLSENSVPGFHDAVGACGSSDEERPCSPTALMPSFHGPGQLSWPRSEAKKFIVVSHAVHSKEDCQRHKREFFFDIKDNGYEYHLYVSRHNIPWETAKQVPGETSTTAFTGIITWKEPATRMLYKCNFMTKQVTWDDGRHVFNIETGSVD